MTHTTEPIPGDRLALSALRAGQTAKVEALDGGHVFASRLVSLGFTPGARLRVVQNYGHGPLIVSLRDTRVALGRGEAGQILVKRPRGGEEGDRA